MKRFKTSTQVEVSTFAPKRKSFKTFRLSEKLEPKVLKS